MIFVITGDGKGKTTSAMGMLCRARGRNLICSVYQFIKQDPDDTGEYSVMKSIGVKWQNFGCGFTWMQKNLDATAAKCLEGWEKFKQESLSGKSQFIVLDEFTYVTENHFVSIDEVVSFLRENKDKNNFPHIVITGRRADSRLVDIADTVSEIKNVKHHFQTTEGIEF